MHNVRFIQRKFPKQASTIIAFLVLLSISAVALGLGLLISN